jgi:hypothetical protein
MRKANLKLVRPSHVNRKVMPERPANADLRDREYLTEGELAQLTKATKSSRYPHRTPRSFW